MGLTSLNCTGGDRELADKSTGWRERCSSRGPALLSHVASTATEHRGLTIFRFSIGDGYWNNHSTGVVIARRRWARRLATSEYDGEEILNGKACAVSISP